MVIREGSVTVSLIDQGHSFDPRKVRDPDLQRYVDIGKKGGLGIFIIRRVIDEIDYRKTVEGNELRLTKTREVSKRRRILPDLSITMKTRFSLMASAILTAIALMVFIWNFIQQEKKILNTHLNLGQELARYLAIGSSEHLEPDNENYGELARLTDKVWQDHANLVVEAAVVDTVGLIQGSSITERLLRTFERGPDAIQIEQNIYQYTLRQVSGDKKLEVYDIHREIIESVLGREIRQGRAHILLNKNVIDAEIASARRRVVWTLGLVLVLGYLGVFALIYVTLSPFKKLATWIRDLGQETARDDIEFDTSDEVGEIAKAFNDITEKFRKSQEDLAEQERLQKEMQVAQEIQHTLLPAAFPEIEGYEIASYYEAAKQVGGDYFDFVEVDKDTLGIVVADVSGKGVPGSLVMTMIRTALRTEARGNKNAADVLGRVNDFVINDMKRGMFVTVFYMILDSHTRTINYASAGHNPLILYRSNTQKSYYLNPRGFPIGINLPDNSLFRKSIQSDSLRLHEGDVLICYTDGITEAMNPQRERFGDERLLSVIRKHGDQKVDPLVDKIRDEINGFTEGYAQSDDITLVAIKEKLRAEDVLFNLRYRMMHLVNEEGLTVKEACRTVGVSTSTYYKYKKRYKAMGEDGLKEKIIRSEIEEKHVSIEDKAKIYDIISKHPEYGAKRISEELNTEKYGNVSIGRRRLYAELVRSHLNTKDFRLAFIEKGGKGKPLKPPGTPLLTLDGQVILDRKGRITDAQREEAEEGEIGEKKTFEMRVSQKPRDEIYTGEITEGEEKETVLDEFLDISRYSEESETGEEVFDQEEVIEGEQEEGTETLEKEDIEKLEVEEEIVLGGKESEPEEKETEAFTAEIEDELFNEILTPSLEEEEEVASYPEEKTGGSSQDWLETSQQSQLSEDTIDDDSFELLTSFEVEKREELEDEEVLDLDHILATDRIDILEEGEGNRVEEGISTSVADELLDEELGIKEKIDDLAEIEVSPEETFLDLMEDIGFDRRTVLSQAKKGKAEKAIETSRDSKELSKKRHLEAGLWFYRQGHYNKAIEELQKAMKKDPSFTEAFQCLGDSYFRLGQLDKALEAYERVRRLDPNNVDVLENLGVIFANRGDYKKAVWQWGEVLKRNPSRRDIIERIKKMQRVIRQRYL
jgi:serine phosphatase RsbU (regulator of sigma subunit)/tetratricopeptide (TPR) repeat protein/transposase